ncbi:transmembrane protein 88B [Erinaceus europaeus]|uniref:Transmembrane protein 88B n=1 Tax=Erinaceus europaeus TaxID=9365 RepID=A0A1S2ZWS2_ERIEU|nr:transmembrane protein 88B [Erinaceus europaeus]
MDEQERELEEEEEEDEEGGSTSDTAPMLPQRCSDDQTSPLVSAGDVSPEPLSLRTLRLSGQALAGLLHLLLPAAIFLLVLLPAASIVYLGFLCHSRVHPAPLSACRSLLSDRGSAALIVSGFLSLPPLLVLASAARARLAGLLRLLLPLPSWIPGRRRFPGSGDPEGEEQLCARV